MLGREGGRERKRGGRERLPTLISCSDDDGASTSSARSLGKSGKRTWGGGGNGHSFYQIPLLGSRSASPHPDNEERSSSSAL